MVINAKCFVTSISALSFLLLLLFYQCVQVSCAYCCVLQWIYQCWTSFSNSIPSALLCRSQVPLQSQQLFLIFHLLLVHVIDFAFLGLLLFSTLLIITNSSWLVWVSDVKTSHLYFFLAFPKYVFFYHRQYSIANFLAHFG